MLYGPRVALVKYLCKLFFSFGLLYASILLLRGSSHTWNRIVHAILFFCLFYFFIFVQPSRLVPPKCVPSKCLRRTLHCYSNSSFVSLTSLPMLPTPLLHVTREAILSTFVSTKTFLRRKESRISNSTRHPVQVNIIFGKLA